MKNRISNHVVSIYEFLAESRERESTMEDLLKVGLIAPWDYVEHKRAKGQAEYVEWLKNHVVVFSGSTVHSREESFTLSFRSRNYKVNLPYEPSYGDDSIANLNLEKQVERLKGIARSLNVDFMAFYRGDFWYLPTDQSWPADLYVSDYLKVHGPLGIGIVPKYDEAARDSLVRAGSDDSQ